MLTKGPKKIELQRGSTAHILTDDTMKIYRLDENNERVEIHQPIHPDVRKLDIVAQSNLTLLVAVKSSALWSLTVVANAGKEQVDPIPFELPLDQERPLTLREEMQRYIREELSNRAMLETGGNSFEEEDDFDIPDEYDPLSKYELDEIQEEEPFLDIDSELKKEIDKTIRKEAKDVSDPLDDPKPDHGSAHDTNPEATTGNQNKSS